jgi:hypothetical protein
VSGTIHLWRSDPTLDHSSLGSRVMTKCGLVVRKRMNVLYASTAEKLKIPPSAVCKVCYRLGPPWLVVVK